MNSDIYLLLLIHYKTFSLPTHAFSQVVPWITQFYKKINPMNQEIYYAISRILLITFRISFLSAIFRLLKRNLWLLWFMNVIFWLSLVMFQLKNKFKFFCLKLRKKDILKAFCNLQNYKCYQFQQFIFGAHFYSPTIN